MQRIAIGRKADIVFGRDKRRRQEQLTTNIVAGVIAGIVAGIISTVASNYILNSFISK